MLFVLVIAFLFNVSLAAQSRDIKPSKPDLQKVYNEALVWSKTKLEEMPGLQELQSTSGIGVCKGKDADASNVGDVSADAKADLALVPGCTRKKHPDSEDGSLKSSETQTSQDKILVFVSFSMPKASLEALSQGAAQHNAVLVMRGLKNDSFKATQKAFQDLGGQIQSGIEINPEAFDTYHIKRVPVFVLVKAEASNNPKDPSKELARLSGNVSLAFASEKLRGAQNLS